MKLLTMKRAALLCAGLGAVGAIGAFTFSGTSALYTSADQTGQDNSITSGTVTLTGGSTDTLNIPTLVPGDSGRSHYKLTYSGNVPAFVAVDVKVTSTAGSDANGCAAQGDYNYPGTGTGIVGTLASMVSACSGGTGTLPLFDGVYNTGAPNSALGLTMIDYGQNAGSILVYDAIAPKTTCTVPASGPITCTSMVPNVELKSNYTSTDASAYEQWNNGDTVTLRLDVNMTTHAGNAFQGSSADVVVAGHAVQWSNNLASSTSGSPNTSTCDATTFAPSVVADGSGKTFCPASWS